MNCEEPVRRRRRASRRARTHVIVVEISDVDVVSEVDGGVAERSWGQGASSARSLRR